MLSAVYLILLVVFMGVIFADSADAKKFVGSLNQGNTGDGLELAGNGWHSIGRPFTTGLASDSYVLHSVGVQVHTASGSRRADVGIYANNNGAPGNKVYDLTGSVTSTGVRHFTAPPGSTLDKNTTYWVVVKVGSGGGTFRLQQTGSTSADTNPSSGWSLGSQSRYVRRGVAFYDGGLKTGIFGKDRFYNRPHTGRPSISSAAPDGVIQVNHTLTANIADISDINGIIKDTLSYQWILVSDGDETDISGATGSTYTPIDNYVGSRLKVRVSFIDADAYRESAVSAVSDVVRSVEGNAPAVGKPVINGTVLVGQTLTVDTSGIGDENGIPSSFVYQWVRVDGGTETDILGATGSNYTVVSDDGGKRLRLKVEVSFVDVGGFSEGPLASGVTVTVPRAGSVSAITLVDNFDYPWTPFVPAITDTFYVSQEFTTGNHTKGYEIENISLSLVQSLSGFSVSIHNVSSDVPGVKLYQLYGPASRTGRQSFSASSGAVIVLDANTKYFVVLSASASPRDARVYHSTSTSESVSVDGWSIADEYVKSTDGGNTWTTDIYTRFPVVINVAGSRVTTNLVASGKPVINGTVQVGQTLTVDTSGIRDQDGIPSSFTYQWVRVDSGTETDILGATGSTYTVVSDDGGKRLKVKVSFIDTGGFSEGPLVSDATALVPVPVNSPPVFTSSSSFSVNEHIDDDVGRLVASDPNNQDSVTGYSVSGGVDSARFSITNGGFLGFRFRPEL